MAKVTAKYQITIPPKVREKLGIVPGAEVDIAKEGNKYVLVVDPTVTIKKNGGENVRTGLLRWNTLMR